MNDPKICFKKVDYDLSSLLNYIEIGDIGLPDIQRPFVWPNAKVRDLFDSMYRGFPVGNLLFWENAQAPGARPIGGDSKQRATPCRLIIDGQQRLTSLYAVQRGKKVLDNDFKERQIEIAFHLETARFAVTDATMRRDPEWIPSISTIWAGGKSSYRIIQEFLDQLQTRKQLSSEQKHQIEHNLDRLFDLQKYPFTALEIAASVDEEQVADIFVRINSEGKRLNQSDFILTLMSVHWDAGRKRIEAFCREARQAPAPGSPPSPFNHFIQPEPDHLLRAAVAFGFERGRLRSVYQLLRGKDLDSGQFSEDRRLAQFRALELAQDEVVNLNNWHQYLSALVGAGFRNASMISSRNALMYVYAIYLMGRRRFHVPEHQLQRLIGRWFLAATLTSRYTTSPESTMESDLNRIKAARNAEQFAAALEEMMAADLTHDFWQVTLPANLNNAAHRSPYQMAFVAAQNRLGAPVLFSHKPLSDLLDPSTRSTAKPLEQHHLFPRAWLVRQGYDDIKQTNQIANFALIEWPDNRSISDRPPSEYVPEIRARFTEEAWARMLELHALAPGWHQLDYETFLAERRKRMAAAIQRWYEYLSSPITMSAAS